MALITTTLRQIFKKGITEKEAIAATERISAIGTVQVGLENLLLHEHRSKGGLGYWNRTAEPSAPRSTGFKLRRSAARFLDHVYRLRYFDQVVDGLTVSLGLMQLSGKGNARVRGTVNLLLAGTQLVTAPKNNTGGDGSDQVRFLVNLLTGTYQVTRSKKIKSDALWAITLQTSLAYFASGAVKLYGDSWRHNKALVGVMRTRTYGHQGMWEVIRKHPHVSKIIETVTIGLEVGYPLVFVGRRWLTSSMVASVSLMHVFIGYFMGLNRFIPAFLSLQPAVLYCADRGTPKSSWLPRAYLSGVIGVLVAGLGRRWLLQHTLKKSPRFGKP